MDVLHLTAASHMVQEAAGLLKSFNCEVENQNALIGIINTRFLRKSSITSACLFNFYVQ